jgi:hypothetical protein
MNHLQALAPAAVTTALPALARHTAHFLWCTLDAQVQTPCYLGEVNIAPLLLDTIQLMEAARPLATLVSVLAVSALVWRDRHGWLGWPRRMGRWLQARGPARRTG